MGSPQTSPPLFRAALDPAPGRVTLPPGAAPPRSFADDTELLAWALGEVISGADGEPALALHERSVRLAGEARAGDAAAADELAGLVAEISIADLQALIRSLTCWFGLVNLAEDNERIRRLRAAEARSAPAPRRGSPRHAMHHLAETGTTSGELAQ
ncbi:MAG TPA: phosphoenolpyruvate carboxylase, partial [Solirubrobacteraceae bacterium]|nr:phosphoenolpyruvate carboxylase [Solirubrobacteraceae bacterium]